MHGEPSRGATSLAGEACSSFLESRFDTAFPGGILHEGDIVRS